MSGALGFASTYLGFLLNRSGLESMRSGNKMVTDGLLISHAVSTAPHEMDCLSYLSISSDPQNFEISAPNFSRMSCQLTLAATSGLSLVASNEQRSSSKREVV